jgi:hypothetical protein
MGAGGKVMPTAVLLPVLDNTKKKRYIIDVYLI